MPNRHTRASVSLRSAKLRLDEAAQLIATAGDVNAKADIASVRLQVDRIIAEIDQRGVANPV